MLTATKTKPSICLQRVGAAENRQQKSGVPSLESLVKAKGYALYSCNEWLCGKHGKPGGNTSYYARPCLNGDGFFIHNIKKEDI